MTMTNEEWTALLSRVEGHTAGPWGQPDGAEYGVMSIDPETLRPIRSIHSFPPQPHWDKTDHDTWVNQAMSNAALIAVAPTLLEEAKRLREDNERVRGLVRAAYDEGVSDFNLYRSEKWAKSKTRAALEGET